jgi:hypothetical protein
MLFRRLWLGEIPPLDCAEVARVIMGAVGRDTSPKCLGPLVDIGADVLAREWAFFSRELGAAVRSVGVIPDAWKVTSPSQDCLLMTAVEVVHTNHLTDDKREAYMDLRYYAGPDAEFELKVVAA